eukprot:COSAG01_NODE_67168_length_268_cov_0.295858_1_plen_44_part_10
MCGGDGGRGVAGVRGAGREGEAKKGGGGGGERQQATKTKLELGY